MKITNKTNKTKGEKMRKFILPLLVAGVVAFTASQSMAALAQLGSGFSEDTSLGSHYKKMDIVESGAGNFQLSSAIIKTLGVTTDGDTAYGYTTGNNPFIGGYAGAGTLGETDRVMVAPAYTTPCPNWFTSCEASTLATDPQTEDNKAIWDGIVLDDLFSATGQVDSYTDLTMVDFTEYSKSLDQSLDAVFLNGKVVNNGIAVTIGSPAVAAVTAADVRYFNIDQTLDQDVADWAIVYAGSDNTAAKDETMGIYGKLTQAFQIAGEVSSVKGCASKGAGDTAGTTSATSLCSPFETAVGTDTGYHGVDAGADNGTATDMFAWQNTQYLVSDVYDWAHKGDTDKEGGNGIKQNYSAFFQDGPGKAFNYSKDISGNHGSVNLTNTGNTNHSHPDP